MKHTEHPVIDTITLEDTLPRVFADESIPDSQVWRRTLSFERGQQLCD